MAEQATQGGPHWPEGNPAGSNLASEDAGQVAAGSNSGAAGQAGVQAGVDPQVESESEAMVADSSDSDSWETASESDAEPAVAAAGEKKENPSEKGFMQHGCAHYRRRCKLVAPCCGEVVWCRHCHNQEKNENEPDPKKRHTLDRSKVAEVICALCDLRQPASEQCVQCAATFGAFTCMVCKFYDDDTSKQQFHCDQCGICRVGGRANYFHCNTCNCCYSIQLQDTHVCIQNSMACNCPVCFEYLFDSVKPINVMPCGHTIHQECLRGLADHHSYVCPVCLKNYMTASQKQRLWAQYDEAVAQTQMPDEYKDINIKVLCNDCNKHTETKFHVVGHKCGTCGGYNTSRVG